MQHLARNHRGVHICRYLEKIIQSYPLDPKFYFKLRLIFVPFRKTFNMDNSSYSEKRMAFPNHHGPDLVLYKNGC